MKAVVYKRYGGPAVLEVTDVPKPTPQDNEVLIKVFAVSINDWDFGLLHGDFVNRLMFGLFNPKRQILGSDIAGVIEAVGKNVTLFKPGDEVYGDLSGQWGGFAEYVCATENMIALKSPAMTFIEAAAIPQAGMLAVQGLIDMARIRPGQKLLINGAGGGVGTFGIQLAKLHGLEVTGVDTAAKFDLMRSVGASHVIDYTKDDFTRLSERYDVILDAKTNRSVFDYLRVLKPNGLYATVGGSMSRLLQMFITGPVIRWFSDKRIGIVVLKANKDLQYMNDVFEAGKVRCVIDGPYQLEQVADAFRVFAKGEHKGKMVIEITKQEPRINRQYG